LVSSNAYSTQQVVDFVAMKFPERKVPAGEPEQPLPDVYQIDTTTAKEDLGISFREFDESFGDTFEILIELEKSFIVWH
jgi:hypothetical protein